MFSSKQTHDTEKTARTFNRLMFLRKVHAALRMLSQNEVGGGLSLDDPIPIGNGQNTDYQQQTVHDVLLE